MAATVSTRLTAAEGRNFAFTLVAAFGLLAVISALRGRHTGVIVFGTPAALLALLGALVPSRLGPFQKAWMGLAHGLSLVMTPVTMGIFYFAIVTPLGFLRRRLGANPLALPAVNDSYWRPVAQRPDRDTAMTRQF